MHDYVTKTDFATFETRMVHNTDYQLRMIEMSLSRQITKEVSNSFWRIIPIVFTLMVVVNGSLFLAIKALVD